MMSLFNPITKAEKNQRNSWNKPFKLQIKLWIKAIKTNQKNL